MAIILTFALVIACFVVPETVIADPTSKNVWTGERTAPTKGSGTLSDPYLIETAEEFAYMMLEANGGSTYDKGATYKLMNDIYLNDISKINWFTGEVKAGYTPRTWEPEIFSGIIQGNGHMVYGLYIERNPEAYTEKWGGGSGAALISENWVNKWIQIDDMGMDCVYVNSSNVSAVFIAGANRSNGSSTKNTFNGCYIGNNVTVKGFATGGFYGGGYGTGVTLKFKNCVSLATNLFDNNRNRKGGLVGDMWGSDDESINNCYSVLPLYGNNAMGGSFTNNYENRRGYTPSSATLVSLENMQGTDALLNIAKMPNLGSGFVATEGFPVPVAFADTLGGVTSSGKVWNGTMQYPSKGNGTKESPYEIATAEQLAWAIAENGNAHFKLTADIHLNDVTKINWSTGEPLEGYEPNEWYYSNECKTAFSGSINGNGHMIYGLYYKKAKPENFTGSLVIGYGLLPKAAKAELYGIGIDKAYMEAYTNYCFGAFIGNGQSHALKGSIKECFVGSDVTLKGYDVGALIGGGSLGGVFTLTDCYSLATLVAEHRVGLVGDCWTNHYEMTNIFATSGKLLGNHKPVYSQNCYTTVDSNGATKITAAQMTGKVTDGNAMVLSDAFVATESTPVLKIFAGDNGGWNGLAEPFTNGDGASEDTAYEISTLGQLAHAVALGGSKYYKLVNDIYINDIDKINWSDGTLKDDSYTPNKWFEGTDNDSAKYNGFSTGMSWKGTLDGNGFMVCGLWYSPDFSAVTVGLIPGVSSGTIKNLSLSNSYVVGGRFTGAISSTFAGTADGVVVDETVTVIQKKNVVKDSYSVGGLFGYTNGITIRNCAFYGNLTGTNHIYGLVGTSWGSKIDAANSFSIGYQPFTASIAAKKFTTKEEADANCQTFYGNLYKVSNVYSDTYKNNNSATYKYDSDGVDTDGDGKLEYDQTGYYSVCSFTKLTKAQMMGSTALTNMSAIDDTYWYATFSYPRTYSWARTNGDLNFDGKPVLSADIREIKNHILGVKENNFADMNGDGNINVCDLVKAWNSCPQRNKSNGETYFMKRWMGYYNADIVYAAADADAKTAAESFASKMAAKGIALNVYADNAVPEKNNEVLFGNTNRGLFDETVGNGMFSINVIDSKLVFSAGALSDTDSGNPYTNAISDFMSFYDEGFAPVITGFHTYEGSVTLKTAMYGSSSKTFTAVWGDEFYGSDLNPSKWDCNIRRSHMSGYTDMVLLDDDETVNVSDGRLRMTAKAYSDPNNELIKYAAPASVHTLGLMEYKYGYAEIRARVPFRTGIWPSFWMKSATSLGGRSNYDYMVEVDMFEVFGNTSKLASNVHKWYSAEGKAKYGLTDSQTHIMARDDQGNWLGNVLDKITNGEDTVTVSGTPEDWHTYGMAWDSSYMYMYVDHKLFRRYTIGASDSAKTIFGSDAANKDSGMSGFHDPLYVIFNNHIFTEHASYKPNTITGYESSNLPAHYDIDYFRLYQTSDSGTELYTK